MLCIVSSWEICEVRFGVSLAFDRVLRRMDASYVRVSTVAGIFYCIYLFIFYVLVNLLLGVSEADTRMLLAVSFVHRVG